MHHLVEPAKLDMPELLRAAKAWTEGRYLPYGFRSWDEVERILGEHPMERALQILNPSLPQR